MFFAHPDYDSGGRGDDTDRSALGGQVVPKGRFQLALLNGLPGHSLVRPCSKATQFEQRRTHDPAPLEHAVAGVGAPWAIGRQRRHDGAHRHVAEPLVQGTDPVAPRSAARTFEARAGEAAVPQRRQVNNTVPIFADSVRRCGLLRPPCPAVAPRRAVDCCGRRRGLLRRPVRRECSRNRSFTRSVPWIVGAQTSSSFNYLP